MEHFPKLITAVVPGQENRFYLVDHNLNFVDEVKDLVDQKINSRRAPATVRAICVQLRWYYRFLYARELDVFEAKPSDLSDFVLWLSNPYRSGKTLEPLEASTINHILDSVARLYKFLVRRGRLAESPVVYETVFRRWDMAMDGDLLAHTRNRHQTTLQRMELKLKEPQSRVKTVSPADFERFINHIGMKVNPHANPIAFRNQLMLVVLRESGLRSGELLGIRMEDLDFGAQGIHIRFRPDNENGSRAKAGYGRDRFVHLPAELLGLLDIYITEVWVNATHNSDYLWLTLKKNAVDRDGQNTYGKALTQTAFNDMFTYYSEKSGVKIHPHMLRHTHATDLVRSYLNKGEPVDWKFISDRLGHSTVVTTMKIYTHLTKEDNKTAYQMYLKRKQEADAKRQQRHRAIS